MKLDKVYYNASELYYNESIKDYCSIADYNSELTYFLFIKEYSTLNNEILISDNYLNKLKNKTTNYNKRANYKENYILYFGGGYFWASKYEDLSEDDLELSPDEFAIKSILE